MWYNDKKEEREGNLNMIQYKKYLCFALCFLLVFSSFSMHALAAAVSADMAGGAAFSDTAEMKYSQQNGILVSLGIISGMPDGTFQPNRMLSRAEASVILSRLEGMENGGERIHLNDIPAENWASPYAGYCIVHGLLKCLDENNFAPGVSITVRDFCRALLMVIGYRDIQEDQVETLVSENRLMLGSSLTLDSFVNRDNASLIIYNAINCYEIAEWQNGKPVYYTDDLLNPVTVLEHRYHAIKYSAMVEANELADLKVNGGFLAQGQTRLKDHSVFKTSTPVSLVGHRADVFVRDGEILGAPQLSPSESSATFHSLVEYGAFFGEHSQFSIAKDAKYYLSYNLSTEKAIWTSADRITITVIDYDCNGSFETILVNPYYKGTVVSLKPFEVQFTNGKRVELKSYSGATDLALEDTVYVLQLANSWVIEK